ncbi:MAG TPA: winged helix-turn-helix domain-containing protein [Blastocatellia bacterium]|nr:winged helix-turn-helix domain-containing protein [Blastocatellia bacterium]
MSHPAARALAYRFDDFYLDGANRQLWRGDEPVSLNSKYLDVLLLLISDGGRLVEKQRIFDEVWQGVFVTDAALTQCIKDIRRQIGDDASNPRYIKTIPKHGYSFIGVALPADPGLMGLGAARSANLEYPAVEQTASGSVRARPYKFLDYYTQRDADLFFGRDQEIELISSQILSRRTFIVHGRSGVGKSSLLRAGLMTRLSADGHRVFIIRSFADPLQEIASALAQVSGTELPNSPTADVLPMAQAACAEGSEELLIFFLDQFEDFFLQAGEDARDRFINATGRLVEASDLGIRLVFAIREDMLAEMSAFKSAVREVFHHEYRLERLSREQAARAITEPARAVGCEYDSKLVERLLSDLGDDKGVDPPQLQIVCDNLYDARSGDGRLTLELYESLGTASRILAGYLERVLRRFRAEDLRATRWILTALISDSGQRRVLRESELVSRIACRFSGDAGQATSLVEELVASRIVRRRSHQGLSWIELAHDFLTAEITRWLTEDEIALKRARAVIERAVENHRAHQLIMDADALELVLPFEEQLGLSNEEADLLVASCFGRARVIPEWLIFAAPGSSEAIAEACENRDPAIRICALDAARVVRSEQMQEIMRRASLWDRDLMVRKAASIGLARSIGTQAQDLLSNGSDGSGPIRRAVSLAMIRDYDKQLIRLRDLSPAVALLVVGGLMWVRLRRDSAEIVRQGVGGLLGGAASGLAGGFLLGLGLSLARKAAPIEGIGLILVLGSLGFFIGGLGGAGVSFGMVWASHVAYRHSRWWSVVGGAVGGAFVGGTSNLLGVDAVRALFGQTPAGLTGAMEGAAIGAGVSVGIILGPAIVRSPRWSTWSKIAGASMGAMIAGITLASLGGNLFSASLEIVAKMFANSQIRMDVLARLFGQVAFGSRAQVVLGAIEGLLFGGGVAFGIHATTSEGSGSSETSINKRPIASRPFQGY